MRQNAHRSLRKIAGFEDSEFESFAAEELRARQVAAIRSRWDDLARARLEEGAAAAGGAIPAAVPLRADGQPVPDVRDRLQAARDHTPLTIAE